MMTTRGLTTAAAFILSLSLAACGVNMDPGKPIDSLAGRLKEKEARLATQAAVEIEEGRAEEALAKYKRLYDGRLNKPEAAVNYAQLLRRTGNAAQAAKVLEPFVRRGGDIRDNADPVACNEYAAALIALGRFEEAEAVLNAVLERNDAAAFRSDAYNLMGVALDAQGQHKEAEQMFRLSLEGWKGDSTSVMNNLALSLAALGRFDESLSLLRKALVMAPEKEEVARNISIVEDLRNKVVRKAAGKK